MTNDIDKVKEIIARSGNTFHCKVLNYLKENGWIVIISPYYNDNVSDKPREIDLIAEKAFVVNDSFGQFKGTVNIKLFIECKYIPQKTVFWFHTKDRHKAYELVLKTTPLRKDNSYTEKHHYLSTSDYVAKLFANERQKATENEIFYKAINQSLNSLVYYRGSKSIIPIPEGRRDYILTTINYPAIICNSFENLYRVDIDSSNDPVNINENFQLEVNYAYLDSAKNQNDEYFLIDLIDFSKIDTFLKTVEEDVNAMEVVL